MNNVFRTIHDTHFEENKYLYHYTSFESALKILSSNKLRFSNLYCLNDPTEYKPKIIFSKDFPEKEEILTRCRDFNSLIKICCFSQDNTNIKRFPKGNNLYFTDHTGRGFAHPRMWAQYADNNRGICFIFNKARLEAELDKYYSIIAAKAVVYVQRYRCYRFTSASVSAFKKQVLSRTANDSIIALKFFSTYPNYIAENYFTKFVDWHDENEYRIALFSPNSENLMFEGINKFLEGIIIGEQMNTIDQNNLLKILPKSIPVAKIIFTSTQITLE